jgi:hypothetical protein
VDLRDVRQPPAREAHASFGLEILILEEEQVHRR